VWTQQQAEKKSAAAAAAVGGVTAAPSAAARVTSATAKRHGGSKRKTDGSILKQPILVDEPGSATLPSVTPPDDGHIEDEYSDELTQVSHSADLSTTENLCLVASTLHVACSSRDMCAVLVVALDVQTMLSAIPSFSHMALVEVSCLQADLHDRGWNGRRETLVSLIESDSSHDLLCELSSCARSAASSRQAARCDHAEY
jgi:hypothetical protein